MNPYLGQFISKTYQKSGKALDLGAGMFFDVACLSQMGWKCEGVDILKGIDLEKKYISKKAPFDLVYSNYVLHRLKNRDNLLQTAYDNLKKGGWIFLHTFDISDKNTKAGVDGKKLVVDLEKKEFKNVSFRVFSFYDNEPEHKHWHKILEVVGQK